MSAKRYWVDGHWEREPKNTQTLSTELIESAHVFANYTGTQITVFATRQRCVNDNVVEIRVINLPGTRRHCAWRVVGCNDCLVTNGLWAHWKKCQRHSGEMYRKLCAHLKGGRFARIFTCVYAWTAHVRTPLVTCIFKATVSTPQFDSNVRENYRFFLSCTSITWCKVLCHYTANNLSPNK